MTHIQDIFIKNLRFFRTKKGFSQLKFSELVNISPNYLNAVENGKNFPSVEVLQKMADKLEILPYQLFLERQVEVGRPETQEFVQELVNAEQRFMSEIEALIRSIKKTNSTRFK
jgi:transcriptional regulator with XRE-family HTH domain